ncbi:hypothetical protein [uncultured Gammaproteobacteria bacterium]|nr:hypothetical protein [uncultured Gammaproteobacteria bacterium]
MDWQDCTAIVATVGGVIEELIARTNVYKAWRSPSSASGCNYRSVYKFGGKYYMPSGNLGESC